MSRPWDHVDTHTHTYTHIQVNKQACMDMYTKRTGTFTQTHVHTRIFTHRHEVLDKIELTPPLLVVATPCR